MVFNCKAQHLWPWVVSNHIEIKLGSHNFPKICKTTSKDVRKFLAHVRGLSWKSSLPFASREGNTINKYIVRREKQNFYLDQLRWVPLHQSWGLQEQPLMGRWWHFLQHTQLNLVKAHHQHLQTHNLGVEDSPSSGRTGLLTERSSRPQGQYGSWKTAIYLSHQRWEHSISRCL